MEFNRQFFVADLLTSDTLISGEQNLIKLYVADLIQKTSIGSVYITILGSGRNSVVHLERTLMQGSDNFYQFTFTPAITSPEKLKLLIEVVDNDFNVYPIELNIDLIVRGTL